MANTTSQRFSFEGWSFKEWLKGNGKTIKELVKVGIPYLIAIYATDNDPLKVLIVGVGKLIADSIDYWQSE